MLIKYLKKILFFSLVLFLQLAFIPNLPGFFAKINLIILMMVFISVVYNFKKGLIFGLFWAFFLDLYSPLFFGANLIAIAITMYFVYKIYIKVLTNKSFYALFVLHLIGLFSFNLILFIYKIIFYFNDFIVIDSFSKVALLDLQKFAWQLLLGSVLLTIIYSLFNFGNKRFSAVFVDTIKQ